MVSIVLFIAIPEWVVDDAFISYRYGKNLVEAGTLTWNPYGSPVEGYTGTFLPLLAAGAILVGLGPALAGKALGILSFYLTLLCVRGILKHLKVSMPIILLATWAYVLTSFNYVHSTSGLETQFFGLILTSSCWLLLKLSSGQLLKLAPLLPVIWFLGGFVRPEGFAIGVLSLVLVWVFHRKESSGKRILLFSMPGFLLPVVLYFCWKWSYYGGLIPNTAYAKQFESGYNFQSLLEWGKFMLHGFSGIVVAIGILLFSRVMDKGISFRLRHKMLWVPVGFIVLIMLAYGRAHLYMNYSYRFFAPMFPLFLFLFAWTGERLFRSAKRWVLVVAGLFLLLQSGLYARKFKQDWYFMDYYGAIMEEELMAAGKLIRERLPQEEKVACFLDAGAVAYFGERKAIDFGGLNDAYLAKKAVGTADVVNYFYDSNPGAAVMTSTDATKYDYIEDAVAIVEDTRFEQYTLLKKFENSTGFPYYQFLYIRKDLLAHFE